MCHQFLGEDVDHSAIAYQYPIHLMVRKDCRNGHGIFIQERYSLLIFQSEDEHFSYIGITSCIGANQDHVDFGQCNCGLTELFPSCLEMGIPLQKLVEIVLGYQSFNFLFQDVILICVMSLYLYGINNTYQMYNLIEGYWTNSLPQMVMKTLERERYLLE